MDQPLSPEDIAKEGKRAYERGNFIEAAQLYQASAQGYASKDATTSSAEMLNNSSVAYLKAGDGTAALQTVGGTPKVFAAAGDIRRQGIALGNLGAALEALKRKQEAEEAYQQSADLLAQAGEAELRAQVMQSLSSLQLRGGRQFEAIASMQSGINGLPKQSVKQKIISRLFRIQSKLLG